MSILTENELIYYCSNLCEAIDRLENKWKKSENFTLNISETDAAYLITMKNILSDLLIKIKTRKEKL